MKIYYLLAFLSSTISILASSLVHPTAEQLITRMRRAQTQVCLELSPDRKHLENYNQGSIITGNPVVFSYLKAIIDGSSGAVCAYVFNKYFFEKFSSGQMLLHDLIGYCKSMYREIPIFVNGSYSCNSRENLALNDDDYFENADGLFVNPYMGFNIFDTTSCQDNIFSIVPLQSGKIGTEFAHNAMVSSGPPLWKYIFDHTACLWSTRKNAIPSILMPLNLCDSNTYETACNDTMPIMISGIDNNISDLKKICAFFNIRHNNLIVCTTPNTAGLTTAHRVALKVYNDMTALKNKINELS